MWQRLHNQLNSFTLIISFLPNDYFCPEDKGEGSWSVNLSRFFCAGVEGSEKMPSSRCMWYSIVLMYFRYNTMPMLVFFKVDH